MMKLLVSLSTLAVAAAGRLQASHERSRIMVAHRGRIAVVSNAHLCDLGWLRGLDVEEVGLMSPRTISESRPWLQWIVENYDDLPEVAIFLHGHHSSWHRTTVTVDFLKSHVPTDVTMLADGGCVWKETLMEELARGHELPGLNTLYDSIWGANFSEVFTQVHMACNYSCCAENVVSRKAIRRFSRSVYLQFVRMIDENPNQPWAWIWERTWQNLWQHPAAKSDAEIVARLKAHSSALRLASLRGLSALQVGALHDARIDADCTCPFVSCWAIRGCSSWTWRRLGSRAPGTLANPGRGCSGSRRNTMNLIHGRGTTPCGTGPWSLWTSCNPTCRPT
mmetsp:Transcript_59614/g.138855  ORF Transcript_59614/g.138855 Transcript_59614/m.138855 type:complete len:336 (-) Transcript_59614:342-1349(-)